MALSDIVANFRRGVEQVKAQKDVLVLKAVQMNEAAILDLVTEDQLLDKGIRGNSSPISPPYTPYTKKLKQARGQITSHVTLKDTGDFHNSIFIQYGNDGFEIAASDSKTSKLITKYGDAVLGLTDDNTDRTSEIIADDLKELINKLILTNGNG